MKTLVLTHADCDGICAGAIAVARFPDADIFFTKPVSLYADLKHADAERIVITDIAITKRDARSIAALISNRSRNCEILYFDHHPIPAGMTGSDIKAATYVHELDTSASELIYRHFMRELPRERVWLALYGAIGDYTENTAFAKERIRNWDKRALYFEVSTLVMGIKNPEFESYDAKRAIIRALAGGSNPSDVPGLVSSAKKAVTSEFELYGIIKKTAEKSGNVGIVEKVPHFGFRGPSALFAATVTDTPVGLCIFEKNGNLDITARARTEKVALDRLMDEAAHHVGGSGGGLRQAAGARIPAPKFQDFLKKLNGLLEKGGRL